MANKQLDDIINSFCARLQDKVPEFRKLDEATKALNNDTRAKQIWDEKEERRQTIDILRTQGLPVSQDQEAALKMSMASMRSNRLCMDYLRSTNQARKIAGDIGSQLQEILGLPFSPRKGC